MQRHGTLKNVFPIFLLLVCAALFLGGTGQVWCQGKSSPGSPYSDQTWYKIGGFAAKKWGKGASRLQLARTIYSFIASNCYSWGFKATKGLSDNATTWTRRLRQAFETAGIQSKYRAHADAYNSKGYHSHTALAVRVGDNILVFDLWILLIKYNGRQVPGDKIRFFNGIKLDTWCSMCKQKGWQIYPKFTDTLSVNHGIKWYVHDACKRGTLDFPYNSNVDKAIESIINNFVKNCKFGNVKQLRKNVVSILKRQFALSSPKTPSSSFPKSAYCDLIKIQRAEYRKYMKRYAERRASYSKSPGAQSRARKEFREQEIRYYQIQKKVRDFVKKYGPVPRGFRCPE